MEEIKLKTHLICTNVHEEYHFDWFGKIMNTKPKFRNGKPVFIIIGSTGRMEVNTCNMARVEKCAKLLTYPRGRAAVTTDKAKIYILEEDKKKTLLGVLTHNHVKSYAAMYDSVGCRNEN